jgi:hypothetical protein
LEQKLVASEQKLEQKLVASEQKLEQKLVASEQRVVTEIGKFIEENILTVLEEKATSAEVNRLQNSLDKFGDKVIVLENRVDKLEGKSPVSPPVA